MIDNFTKAIHKAKNETTLWAYAAWTLPLAAIAFLVFEHFIGREDLIDKTVLLITVTFFSISVFWWWWALNKIVVILMAMRKTEVHFEDIKKELRETKEIIREDVGNWQWRKPDSN